MKKYSLMFVSLLLGAFLMQGFQCASPEFTTAKLALKEKDYQKAEEYFEKELSKNPSNGEAWGYLAEARFYLKKYDSSNEAINEALKYSSKDKMRTAQLYQLKRTLWIEAYKTMIDKLNKYYQTKDEKWLDEGMESANSGIKIKPDLAEFVYYKGIINTLKSDVAKANENYQKYFEMIKPGLDFAQDKGIHKGIDRDKVLSKLGNPRMSPGERTQEGDSTITDIFVFQNPENKSIPIEFYMKSTEEKGTFMVETWSYTSEPSPSLADKLVLFDIHQDAIGELVQTYFDKKQYDKSMEYVNALLVIDPMNESANSFMITLYETMGKKDEATKRIESLVKSEPNNKIYRFSYGNLLMQMEDFDEAIVQYEKAIELDDKYYDAIRNAATAYKNRAVKVQLQQFEAMEKDGTAMKPDEYLPDIEKSGKYFQACRKSPKYANDFEVLADLVDIYFVAEDKDNLKQIVAELESIEALVPEEDKSDYYLKMVKIFQKFLPNEEKSKKYEEKYESIN